MAWKIHKLSFWSWHLMAAINFKIINFCDIWTVWKFHTINLHGSNFHHVKHTHTHTHTHIYIYMCIYQPLRTGRMWYKVNFQGGLIGLNSEFSLPNQDWRTQTALLLIRSWKENNQIHTFPKGISVMWNIYNAS